LTLKLRIFHQERVKNQENRIKEDQVILLDQFPEHLKSLKKMIKTVEVFMTISTNKCKNSQPLGPIK